MIAGEFLSNPLCRKITFTGSTEVGQSLIRGAAEIVEAGSFAGAWRSCAAAGFRGLRNLDVAVRETVIAKFRNTGQSCIAANRIYVQKSIYAEFMSRFVAAVKALKVGQRS